MTGSHRPIWRPRIWLDIALALCAGLFLLMAIAGEGPAAVVLTAGIVVASLAMAAWVVRRAQRERQAFEARLTLWAARRAAQEERLALARELHDLASHGLGLITVRAASALHLARRPVAASTDDGRPSAADDLGAGPGHPPAAKAVDPRLPEVLQALEDIERASRAASGELRRMLGLLRRGGAEALPSLQPVAGVRELPALIEQARAEGLEVEIAALDDGLLGLQLGVQLAAYRVVREGLANALRHAGPTRVELRLERGGGQLLVQIDDAGADPGWMGAPGAGWGLAGLRELVDAMGGSLEAGPWGTGFRLRARLPDPGP